MRQVPLGATLPFTSRSIVAKHPVMATVPKTHKCDNQGIEELCRQIAEGLQLLPDCPCCSADLLLKMANQTVEVSCPSGCFHFECRRDRLTGAFVTGLLDFPRPTCGFEAVPAAPIPAATKPIEAPRVSG